MENFYEDADIMKVTIDYMTWAESMQLTSEKFAATKQSRVE